MYETARFFLIKKNSLWTNFWCMHHCLCTKLRGNTACVCMLLWDGALQKVCHSPEGEGGLKTCHFAVTNEPFVTLLGGEGVWKWHTFCIAPMIFCHQVRAATRELVITQVVFITSSAFALTTTNLFIYFAAKKHDRFVKFNSALPLVNITKVLSN